ncbi:nuclear transport factor 2 family protein [Sphingomonas koreensis]|nr:nuclear transport factor 2 family protein [Sphingomonas koreensis]
MGTVMGYRSTRTGAFGAIVVLSIALTVATPSASAAETVDASAILLRQTQEFSDASSQGDAAAMARLLDDRVIFFNEGGDTSTKAEMIASARAPAPGVEVRQTVTDWRCETYGDVAVASFIDDQVATVAGVATRARFRSVETWRSSGGQWRMIGSETIALLDDPTSVELPLSTLHEYAGTYVNTSGIRFVITFENGHVAASVNGGPVTEQRAEVRDVLFTPGRSRFRKIFQRNADGKVVSFAYRREGHDTIFKRIS